MSNKQPLDTYYFQDYESTFDTLLQCEFSKAADLSPELGQAYSKMTEAFHEFQEALTKAGFKGYWNDF
jgi:hypothetical protein